MTVVPGAPVPAPPGAFTEALAVIRADARRAAAVWLSGHGFTPTGVDDEWAGPLSVVMAGVPVPCTVRLPAEFPDALPEVAITPAQLGRRVAHIENSGKICIAPASGTMVDGDRPERVLEDALMLASAEVSRGLSGESDPDLLVEYLAYWPERGKIRVDALVRAEGGARRLVRWRRSFGGVTTTFVAESKEDGEAWAKNGGNTVTIAGASFLVPVTDAIPLQFADTSFTVHVALDLLAQYASTSDFAEFQRWLNQCTLDRTFPLTVLILLPELTPSGGRPLVALEVAAPRKDVSKRAKDGWRVGHVPAVRALSLMAQEPARRANVHRLDGPFLLTRGGAQPTMLNRHVVVAGVGAVGSEMASALAAAGVGRLTLVDPDSMNIENVHRHVLGMDSVGLGKATAMAQLLTRRFPHLLIAGFVGSFDAYAAVHADAMGDADLLILATGEETDERRINALLAGGPPRLHAWLDPVGVAGHALLGGVPTPAGATPTGVTPGCYGCVVVPHPTLGFVNRMSLVAPDQQLQRSYAGCAGTFNPFPASAARRTALEAADLAVAFLSGAVNRAHAVTWRTRTPPAMPVRLSPRARVVAPGAVLHLDATEFAFDDCPVCGNAIPSVVRVL